MATEEAAAAPAATETPAATTEVAPAAAPAAKPAEPAGMTEAEALAILAEAGTATEAPAVVMPNITMPGGDMTAMGTAVPAAEQTYSIYVGNAVDNEDDPETLPQELYNHFKFCGTGAVKRITIKVDKQTGYPMGFAYIDFGDEATMNDSLLLDGSKFNNRELKINKKKVNDWSMKGAWGKGGMPQWGKGGGQMFNPMLNKGGWGNPMGKGGGNFGKMGFGGGGMQMGMGKGGFGVGNPF
eukprot:gnl/TRDRNA2_/TRDRNA2_186112_c0_seq1.p1 gnl/TRDRNA2_/TRDRNA2_186112_c0~~gnl/TRDRNA2_/TRDRNA2_186112_c0_seq1.p1  ORF type:complete len:266 (-),score=63.12 gnl/TRDRNA2_/TRDRNA2_186112_c0_seq1:40-759(-)